MLITSADYMARINLTRVIREAKGVLCNTVILARKALFVVGVPESKVTENKDCVVRNALKR